MRDSKKACKFTAIFLIPICLMSVLLIKTGSVRLEQHNDVKIREAYAGKIDYLFNGASHVKAGFDTRIIDKQLGTESYNLSGDSLSWKGRYYLLKEELGRNPVKTVAVEMSLNDFPTKAKIEYILYTLPRITDGKAKLDIFSDGCSIGNLIKMYNLLTEFGYNVLKDKFNNDFKNKNLYDDYFKGFAEVETNDIRLPDSEVAQAYNSEETDTSVRKENLKYFKKSMDLCKEKGVQIIFVVTPLADSMIWKYSNFDFALSELRNICKDYSDLFVDFNLLKERYDLWNETDCFKNEDHLSPKGAAVFSEVYCDVMKKMESGEDISDMFYTSYEEMKADSPYMKTYKSLTQAE